MTSLKTLFILAAATVALSSQALDVTDVEQVSIRNDLAGLIELRGEAEKQSDPFVAAFLEYRIGVAANAARDTKLAKTSLKQSARILKAALDQTPDSVPHLALLANVYGMQIGISPMKGMTLGRKSNALINRAISIDPSNPHALLVKGISEFNTPSMFGGSKNDALDALDSAVKAFSASPDAKWGAAEAHVWRALALDDQSRREEAVKALNDALTLEPDYAWARFILANMQATG